MIRITEPTDIRLQKLIPLYKEAFPEEEEGEISRQLEQLIQGKNEEMYFNAIETDGVLAGFVYLLGYAGFFIILNI